MIISCYENGSTDIRLEDNVNVSEVSKEVYVPSKVLDIELDKSIKIIKSAETRYKVNSVKNSTKAIKELVKISGGYISNLQFRNNVYSLENTFTIRIPQVKFDLVLDSINNSVEFIEYENISTKDVTEEFIDVESRLKTKLEIKDRYESILRKKAKTVEEILETEKKLGDIQVEIEAAKGRLKYLNNRVTYSTIKIELYETVEYKKEPVSYSKSFWDKSKEGFSNGWSFISILVLGIINIWPVIISAFILIFFIKRKKLKKRSAKKTD